jgi:hypothetical protein
MCRLKMEKVSKFSKFPISIDESAFQWPEKLVERSHREGGAPESEVESLEASYRLSREPGLQPEL